MERIALMAGTPVFNVAISLVGDKWCSNQESYRS